MCKITSTLAVFLFIIPHIRVVAQTGNITGIVIGADQKIMKGAVVWLQKSADSSFVKAALTETDGGFVFENLNEGLFQVMVTHIGYQKYISDSITLDARHLRIILPTITLQPEDRKLTEVKVTGQKPFVEKRIDRTIINPDALISNAGLTSLDILEKSPYTS